MTSKGPILLHFHKGQATGMSLNGGFVSFSPVAVWEERTRAHDRALAAADAPPTPSMRGATTPSAALQRT